MTTNQDPLAIFRTPEWLVADETGGVVAQTITDLTSRTPFYIAHRGSGDEAPEHTLEAYRYAVGAGAKALELSVQRTADGALVCFHDTSMTRMTGVSGAIANYTYAQLKNKIPVKGQDLLGPGWPDLEIPLLQDVLEEFFGRVVLFIEPKTTDAAAPLQQVLLDLPGAAESVVYKSHYNASAGLTWAHDNGFKTWAYVDTDTTSAAMDAIDSKVSFWGVPMTSSDAQISMVVNHAPAKPTIVWEVHRRSQRDAYLALGVKGMMTSGYSYVTNSTAMAKDAHFELGMTMPGFLGVGENDPNEALEYGVDDVTFTAAPNRSALMGAMCPLPASGYKIQFEMKWDTLPAVSNHAGVTFGRVTDAEYQFGTLPTEGGYHFLLRGDGDLQLYTHTAGVGSGSMKGQIIDTLPAPTAGAWMSFEIEVTPTNVIIRRLDSDPDVVLDVANADYRGGYFHLVGGNTTSAAQNAHFRNVRTVY